MVSRFFNQEPVAEVPTLVNTLASPSIKTLISYLLGKVYLELELQQNLR